MSHSKTIKDYKNLFFLSFKNIKLMYYVIHNNPTLLHQTNDDISLVYEKNRTILTVINVWIQCLQVKHIIWVCLVKLTNHLYKYDKKVTVFGKKIGKIGGSHRQYQTSLKLDVCKSLA